MEKTPKIPAPANRTVRPDECREVQFPEHLVAGQDVALTSPVPGTTTDVVEKAMELLPVGPVAFLDTGGMDDVPELGRGRIGRTRRVLDRADAAVLLVEPNRWTPFEDELLREFATRKTFVIAVVNKADLEAPTPDFLERLQARIPRALVCSSHQFTSAERDRTVSRFKQFLLEICPDHIVAAPSLLGDLVPPDGLIVLIIQIDKEAPKGR